MSISSIQKQRVLEELALQKFIGGQKPDLIDILERAAVYFAANPIGTPLKADLDQFAQHLPSNAELFSDLLKVISLNLDVAYQEAQDEIGKVFTLNSFMRTHLERLRAKRTKIVSQIDDYLFSLYNTDGYYFSLSDIFADLSGTDLNLTSAFVDTTQQKLTIPTLSKMTRQTPRNQYSGNPQLRTTADGVLVINGQTDNSFANAIDGLTNTVWSYTYDFNSSKEVIAEITISMLQDDFENKVSRIEINPFTVAPVQVFIETRGEGQEYQQFGDKIQTGVFNMVFVDDARIVQDIKVTMRKIQADYVLESNTSTKYRYIIGMKEFSMSEHAYDDQATFVSVPLFLPEEMVGENVIDAVSLVAEFDEPIGTNVDFFVAADPADTQNPTIDEFDWKPITPLSSIATGPNTIVRFNGAANFIREIKFGAGANELEQIPFDTTNSDLTKRNPSPVIIPGADIYRLTKFTQGALPLSVILEEGVNTTRIYYTNYNASGLDLSYWTNYINGTISTATTYGKINTGNEFFYGADIGESNKSVYVETYLESLTDQEIYLRPMTKIDPNSKQWDIKGYLNGRELINMPVGVDDQVVPWKFNQGLNHVILLITIPQATSAYPNPYLGIIDLMGESNLYDFGTVKLATWKYVDPFKMRYNEVGQPYTFTIINNEIVSRRKPTTGFRVKYAQDTQNGPTAIRLRADLSRELTNPNITPVIDSYRVRFLYAS